MEFIVKCSGRWDNGHCYRQLSFKQILDLFVNEDADGDLDELIDCVANMNVNAVYSFDFFMNDTYTFKRIS